MASIYSNGKRYDIELGSIISSRKWDKMNKYPLGFNGHGVIIVYRGNELFDNIYEVKFKKASFDYDEQIIFQFYVRNTWWKLFKNKRKLKHNKHL